MSHPVHKASDEALNRNFAAMKAAITARDPEAQVSLDPADQRVVMETVLSEAEVLLILQTLVQDVEYLGKRDPDQGESCGGHCCGGCS